MVLGEHAELSFGITVVPLNDHARRCYARGEADGGRQNAR
jgi:hypothetical protein